MIINHNLAANNAIRNMNINSGNANKAMQKLSSGLRINSAADDAAGLAISEKMRGQISGLDQASSNAQDGISLVQTAEGALNETTSILQRMRELAVQGSNDTATDSDRAAMQKETAQLKSEIDRIANTTQFNTKTLLNGDLAAGEVAQGTKLNSVQTTIGATLTGTAAVTFDAFSFSTDQKLSVKIANVSGGAAFDLTIAKGNYTETSLASAIQTSAIAAGMDSDATVTFNAHALTITDGGTPTNTLTVVAGDTATGKLNTIVDKGATDAADGTAGAAITSTDYNALAITDATNDSLTITTGTGANAKTGTIDIATTNEVLSGTELAKAINDAIAANATLNGNVKATFLAGSSKMTMASTDNSQIQMTTSTLNTALNLSTTAATDTTQALLTNLKDSDKNDFGLAAGDVITIKGNINGSAVTPKMLAVTETSTVKDLADQVASALNLAAGKVTIDAAKGTINIVGEDGTAHALSDVKLSAADSAGNAKTLFNNKFSSMNEAQQAQDTHVDSSLNFQIGANEGQTMKVDINKMDVEGLALSSIDVSTQQGAETAISVIDNATAAVSAERAKLGAFQNRLEHTINNLGTSSENLTSSESRIRDVDMAKEMSEYSKNNILSQAAQAMLAQANQQPQQVLQLLR